MGYDRNSEEGRVERRQKYHEKLADRYVRLPTAIFLDLQSGKLTYRDVCLYCYLVAKQDNDDEFVTWGYGSLTLLTGLCETAIKECVSHLSKAGHIRRQPTQSTSKTFCLTRIESDDEATRVFVRGELVKTYPHHKAEPDAVSLPASPRRAMSPATIAGAALN